MSKYTPGPWVANCFLVTQVDGRKFEVCHTGIIGPNKPPEQAEADARLIAAAPDLLQACKAAMRILSLWGPNDCDEQSHLFEENKALSMMQNAFELAIAKAETV